AVDVCTALIVKQPMDDEWNSWEPARIAKLPLSTRFGPFTAWRNELRTTLGEFDERFIAAGDKEFWSRITRAKVSVHLIPKILYLYTRNPGSLSLALRKSERWQKEKALLQEMKLTWPASLRWQVRTIRARRAVQPRFGIVPLEMRTSNSARSSTKTK
ncbi:MAG TPA: hypothetical protein VK530_19865, partial [Candidatus Acidoferrum sp.]|nr:hypothetical protein [Candidatus Acidoferrum sp.]